MQKRLYDVGWSDNQGVEAATQRKAQRSTGCITVRCGGKSETRSQNVWESVSNGPRRRKKIVKGQRGITSHPLNEGNWRKSHISQFGGGNRRSTKVEQCQLKAFVTMSPLIVLC